MCPCPYTDALVNAVARAGEKRIRDRRLYRVLWQLRTEAWPDGGVDEGGARKTLHQSGDGEISRSNANSEESAQMQTSEGEAMGGGGDGGGRGWVGAGVELETEEGGEFVEEDVLLKGLVDEWR